MDTKLTNIIRRAIDIHVHIGPEIIPRKYVCESLVAKEKGNIAGCVLKNHFYPTSSFIAELGDNPGIELYGSVVLNNFVGGLNPEAIYAAALISSKPIMVWFPTINSEAFLSYSEYEIPQEWVKNPDFKTRKSSKIKPIAITKNGQLISEVKKVLQSIKENNAILATGHISWEDTVLLVDEAKKTGIKNIVITHPIYQRINMPIRVQKTLARKGCFIEHCYSMYSIDEISIADIARQVREVGCKSVVLSSDVGQMFSPSPSEALYDFARLLIKEGFVYKELEQMLVVNPRHLLSVEIKP